MHKSFRNGFEKKAFATQEEADAYTKGVIAGYKEATEPQQMQPQQMQDAQQLSGEQPEQTGDQSQQGTDITSQASYNPATQAGQSGMPNNGIAPLPQRSKRDYGEQFAGAQTPYSAMY
jgi:hypothetical protein